MPNDTVRANAQAMPIDRRTALSGLAAAGAMLIAPHAAKAAGASPDAELIALAQTIKALGLESDAAAEAAEEMEDNFEPPPPPECLLIREGDEVYLGVRDGALGDSIGTRFSEIQLRLVRSMRAAYQRAVSVFEANLVKATRAQDYLFRATEIDLAAADYLVELKAAKEAAGIPAAQAKAEALSLRVQEAWRALTFLPAQTVEGALAKIDAVAHCFCPPDATNHPVACDADDVLSMAVFELAKLRAATEA